MYLIITYDVGEKRINRMRKLLKKYLTWVQNSVFEGELSEGRFIKCLKEMEKLMDRGEDSVYIYKLGSKHFLSKQTLGIEKGVLDFIL